MKIAIDGRILNRNISGTERYIWEIYSNFQKDGTYLNGDAYLVVPREYNTGSIKKFIYNLSPENNIGLFLDKIF